MGKAWSVILSKMPASVQVWVTISAVFAAGGTTTLVMVGWVGLPAEVAAHSEAIAADNRSIADLERRLDAVENDAKWVRCFLGAQASGENPISRCGL